MKLKSQADWLLCQLAQVGRALYCGQRMAGVPGQWIGPVSDRKFEEVSAYEQRYQDGSDPLVLDIIEVPVLRANPKAFQQENWLIDSARRWVQVGRIGWEDLPTWIDEDALLWINGHSLREGVNDRVPVDEANRLSDSLNIIKVERLLVIVDPPKSGKTHPMRGHFRYNGVDYRLKITDVGAEKEVKVYLAASMASANFVI